MHMQNMGELTVSVIDRASAQQQTISSYGWEGSKVTHGFLTVCTGVGVPNSCVVQGSTVIGCQGYRKAKSVTIATCRYLGSILGLFVVWPSSKVRGSTGEDSYKAHLLSGLQALSQISILSISLSPYLPFIF